MPTRTRYFTVTVPQGLSTLKLDIKGNATCQITVKNVSSLAIDGRAILTSLPVSRPPAGAVEKGWVRLEGAADRHFDVDQDMVFSIRIAVPQPKKGEAPPQPGNYSFRLDVVNIARPDDSSDQSQALSFTVPVYVPPPPSKLPLILAVAALVLVIAGVTTWLVLRKPATSQASVYLGAPVVGHNLDGRLEVFVVAKNGDLLHRVQSAPNAGLGAWQTLAAGSALTAGPLRVGYDQDGRMEVYGIQNGGVLWRVWQTAANGGWSSGVSMGAPAKGIVGGVTVGNYWSGGLELFAFGSDQQLYHIWQVVPNGAFGGWASLGAPAPGVSSGDPRVVSNADGRVEVFVLANDQKLWHIYHTGAKNSLSYSAWSSWEYLGGPAAAIANGAPFVGNNADGRIEVFTTGTDGAIYHIYQTVPSGGWSAWSLLQAPAHEVQFLGSGTVANNKDRRFQLFFIGSDGGLWTLAQAVPSGGWGQVRSLNAPPGQVLSRDQTPASGLNGSGNLTVFITGTDGNIWHISQTSPGGSWGSLVKD
jgi:hypothetical protein